MIKNGTITANGGSHGAGIGGVHGQSGGKITITGGTVNANGGFNGAGIGNSAGAVVTKGVGAYSVVAGVPAKK